MKGWGLGARRELGKSRKVEELREKKHAPRRS